MCRNRAGIVALASADHAPAGESNDWRYPGVISRLARWLSGLPVVCLASVALLAAGAAPGAEIHDIIIRGGTVYDGYGGDPVVADLALDGDRITAIGQLSDRQGRQEIAADGLAVAPGFINMLSWAGDSLQQDPRALSDVKQGVTLEILGEGISLGPAREKNGGASRTKTLAQALDALEARGIGVNIASFVGATTLRIHELGFEGRQPAPAELARMQELAREAMREGALGLSSALIYSPGVYASTAELVALAAAVEEFDGMYISHLRSEAAGLLEALEEFLRIAREAQIRAEIFHLKAAGEPNWPKLETLVERIEEARQDGLEVTANMYPYTAALTGLDAAMPPWVRAGGYSRWASRLRRPSIRERVKREMLDPEPGWENLYLAAGGADNILLVGFSNARLRPLMGMTLAEVAAQHGKSPEDTAMDLVIEDGSRVRSIYPLMAEANVQRKIRLPWVSFCSDAPAPAPQAGAASVDVHPRAYGSFARLLGHYVRDERIIELQEAIRKLTSLPAKNLRLRARGALVVGHFGDVVIFDPASIQDHATYEQPHQLASGMRHVFVNGVQVVRDGQHTGELPGRVVRGPGWRGGAGVQERVAESLRQRALARWSH
jgi:N-acyl-D-amino-acid deacylase